MRSILIISKLPPPLFGTTIWSENLLKSGLNQHFKLIHFNNNLHKKMDSLGKPTLVNSIRNLILYSRLLILLQEKRPELVFIPISQTTLGFLKDSGFILISKLTGRKVLLILHGGAFLRWINNSSSFLKYYVRFVIKRTQGIIVLGFKLKIQFIDYFTPDHIYVVPNGGNYNFPVKESSKKYRLLYLGNMMPSKGITELLQSVELLNYHGIPLIFDMVGAWPDLHYKNSCLDFARNNHLPIVFHDPASGQSKYQYLSNADLFLFTPNAPEGHPLVIIEAMAAGLPIITTDQGAITESVIDGVNGFIVKPNSPEEIAEKIRFLIDNPDERIRMGKVSRKLYEENFTEEKMVERLKQVFDKVLSQP